MASMYIYIVLLEAISILMSSGTNVCSCSQCQLYQNRYDRCRCCHYHQIGGKRSEYIVSPLQDQDSAADTPELSKFEPVSDLSVDDATDGHESAGQNFRSHSFGCQLVVLSQTYSTSFTGYQLGHAQPESWINPQVSYIRDYDQECGLVLHQIEELIARREEVSNSDFRQNIQDKSESPRGMDKIETDSLKSLSENSGRKLTGVEQSLHLKSFSKPTLDSQEAKSHSVRFHVSRYLLPTILQDSWRRTRSTSS